MENLGFEADAQELSLGTGYEGGTRHSLAGATLIPYWQTSVYTEGVEGTQIPDVINWSCSYNSDLQVLKCCNYQETPPIAPDYILCGEMSGEGSLTVFALRESGACSFSPEAFHGEKTDLTFKIGFGSTTKNVVIPFALINSGSTAMATGASYISCDYSFTAIGDGVHSIMTMSE